MLFFLLRSLIFFFWLKFDAMTKSVEDRGLYIQVVVCILNLEDQNNNNNNNSSRLLSSSSIFLIKTKTTQLY